MKVDISCASHALDLAAARSLRRSVFEEELGCAYGDLDDPLDDYSLVLLARWDERVIASARLTQRRHGPLEDEGELLLERWTASGAIGIDQIAGCSRLAVAPAFRGQGVVAQLAAHLYAHSLQCGLRLLFLDASHALVPYYLALGFRVFRPPYLHPVLRCEYWPLVLFIGDAEYFERVGSPLASFVVEDSAAQARSALAALDTGCRRFGEDSKISMDDCHY